jgi:hypothetical protein
MLPIRRIRSQRRPRVLSVVALLLLLSSACNDSLTPSVTSTPERSGAWLVSSAAVQTSPGFAFLPPIAPAARPTGAFDPTLSPVVTVCEWLGQRCASPPLAEFDVNGGGSERVRVSEDEHYVVNWSTAGVAPDLARTYRIIVKVAGVELGHASVVVVRNGSDKKSVDPALSMAVVSGQTLPIKFRIEKSDATGSLYALSYEGEIFQGVQRIIRIDPASGAMSVMATVPGVQYVSGGTAFDPGTGRFFFYGSDGTSLDVWTRYAVNLRTGEIYTFGTALAWPDANENAWQFDPTNGLLYALSYTGEFPHGVQRIISIDPGNGAVAVAATIPGVHLVSGEATFDPATGRYFFSGSDGTSLDALTRYAVNVRTGEIHTFGTQLNWPPANEGGWEFDRASGLLYALSYDGEYLQGVERIISIDPGSGAVSVVATVPGVHLVIAESAFDPATGRYFFYGSDGSSFDMTRYSVNVRTGEVRTFGMQLSWPPANEVSWQFAP